MSQHHKFTAGFYDVDTLSICGTWLFEGSCNNGSHIIGIAWASYNIDTIPGKVKSQVIKLGNHIMVIQVHKK